MHLGVQRFHATIEHFRKAGKIGHFFHGQFSVAQSSRRAPGGDQLHAQSVQKLGKADKAGFIGNGKQCAANGGGGHRETSTTEQRGKTARRVAYT